MSTTFADHLPTGDHASRPAAGDVPEGTLYSCTDHDLIYQSDGAAAWSTWATVGGGGSDADAIHDNVAGEITAITEKATPVDADVVLIEDSEDSDNKKRVELGNLPGGGGATVPEWVTYLAERVAGETGTADDDFFDDATPPGSALTVSGSATWEEEYGRLGAAISGQSGGDVAARIITLTSPSAPFTVETRGQMIADGATAFIGVGFSDGTTASDDAVTATAYVRYGTDYRWLTMFGTLTSIYGGTVTTTYTGQVHTVSVPVYLRAIWVSSNSFKCGFRVGGSPWVYTSLTPTFTPTHATILGSSDGGGSAAKIWFDYFRATADDLS